MNIYTCFIRVRVISSLLFCIDIIILCRINSTDRQLLLNRYYCKEKPSKPCTLLEIECKRRAKPYKTHTLQNVLVLKDFDSSDNAGNKNASNC